MMPGANSSVNSTISSTGRPNSTGRDVAYASAMVTASAIAVPTIVTKTLTRIARPISPPLNSVWYAFTVGCDGHSTYPPASMMSLSLASDVEITTRIGTTITQREPAQDHRLDRLVPRRRTLFPHRSHERLWKIPGSPSR